MGKKKKYKVGGGGWWEGGGGGGGGGEEPEGWCERTLTGRNIKLHSKLGACTNNIGISGDVQEG